MILPTVIIELILGILLGSLPIFKPGFHQHPALAFMVELGAIILLFEVGLESTFGDLKRVGAAASRVAVVGILAPLILGAGVSYAIGITTSLLGHIFMGATLTATSVGITARVLRDLGQSQSMEAKVILTAAVLDDILGLVLLALVTALVQSAGVVNTWGFIPVLTVVAKSALFVLLVATLGQWLVPFLLKFVSRKRHHQYGLFIGALLLCLTLSGLAPLFGLAPIIGAFFAGLLLPTSIGPQLKPLSKVFVPLFFIITGMRVDLSVFLDIHVFKLGCLISLAAIFGKIVSGWVAGRNTNKWVIGVGMIPRGEVGIIFASLGASLMLQGRPLFAPPVFGAVIMMVTITSILSPLWLGYLLKRK